MTPIDCFVFFIKIPHQILDSADLQPKPLPKPQTRVTAHHPNVTRQLGPPLNGVTLLNQLRNDTGRGPTREPAEIHRSLGMAAAFTHATNSGPQRQHMSRTAELIGPGRRVGEAATGQSAVMRGDSRGDGRVMGVYGDGICGAHGVVVVDDHEGEVQLVGAGGEDGSANVATDISQTSKYIEKKR